MPPDIEQPRNISDWCRHFIPAFDVSKDKIPDTFDCSDCSLHNLDCPFERDSSIWEVRRGY
jgi:hypothetical protein